MFIETMGNIPFITAIILGIQEIRHLKYNLDLLICDSNFAIKDLAAIITK